MLEGLIATFSRMIRPNALHEVPEFHLMDRLVGQIPLPRRQIARHPRIVLLPGPAALIEDTGRIAILLVFQEPPHKLLPGVFEFLLDLIGPRQHLLRLDLDQEAGHGHEVAHRANVELLQDGQVLQVLVRDQRDGNIDDFHLVLAHQVEEQVQRAAENVQVNVKIHRLAIILPFLAQKGNPRYSCK